MRLTRRTAFLPCLALAAAGILAPGFAQDKKGDSDKKTAGPKPGAGESGKEKAMPTGRNGEMAVIETNLGSIKLKFFPDAAPKAVENFLGLATQGKYDGVIFHRVIDGFMIQGGDPTGTGRGGQSIWGKSFEDECSPALKFDRKGLLAMANAGKNTNGSQFFITCAPTSWLNGKHTIFGEVTSGMDVVDKIENAKTNGQDRPVDQVEIIKVTVLEPQAAK